MRHHHRVRFIILLAFVVLLATPVAAFEWEASINWRWYPEARWDDLFDLESGTTYIYDLTAYRWGRAALDGELRLERSGSQMRITYSVGKTTGRAVTASDPQAIVGGLMLAAMTGSDALSYEALELLVTPLKFVQWLDSFADARFRDGRVWEEFAQPPVRFEAREVRRWDQSAYEGEVRRGSQTVLSMSIDLDQPLPLRVESTSGEWRFVAELRSQRSSQRILR